MYIYIYMPIGRRKKTHQKGTTTPPKGKGDKERKGPRA
jgi:hypothetical protein